MVGMAGDRSKGLHGWVRAADKRIIARFHAADPSVECGALDVVLLTDSRTRLSNGPRASACMVSTYAPTPYHLQRRRWRRYWQAGTRFSGDASATIMRPGNRLTLCRHGGNGPIPTAGSRQTDTWGRPQCPALTSVLASADTDTAAVHPPSPLPTRTRAPVVPLARDGRGIVVSGGAFGLRGRGRRRERSGKASIPGPRLEEAPIGCRSGIGKQRSPRRLL